MVIPGDSAYPFLPWLLNRFSELRIHFQKSRGITVGQLNSNHQLSRAQMTVRKSFGCLKGLWRSHHKQNDAHIILVSRITSACCVLHNFCEVHNKQFKERNKTLMELVKYKMTKTLNWWERGGVMRLGMHRVPTFQG